MRCDAGSAMLSRERLKHGRPEGERNLNKKAVYWTLFGVFVLAMASVQFIPSPPLQIPVEMPAAQRDAHRLINFEGIDNFRDLGGYPAAGGKTVKWGTLYRSGSLSEASRADQQGLLKLGLHTLIDLRSAEEKEAEPNQLPATPPFRVVEIPVLDGGAQGLADEITSRIDDGTLATFDANAFMIAANRQFANEFTPQFRQFVQALQQAEGQPVLWHCTAGKDRTGFAAAILLRILGVSQEQVLADYALSKESALDAHRRELTMLRLFKGEDVAAKVGVLLGAERPWLLAAFEEIDQRWGDFDKYLQDGLQLGPEDIANLRQTLLE